MTMTPIVRSKRVLIAAIAMMATLLSGTGVATASTAQAKAVPVKKWASAVCTDFGKWETRLVKLSARGALADPTAGKAAITKFVNGALKATDNLAKQLKAAGVPSVKNGKAVQAGLLAATKSLRAAYATAKTGADALPTADAAAFSVAAKALATQLQTASAALTTTLATAAKSSPGGALDKAFTSTKACTKLT